MKKKIALVTGGGRGIGFEVCRQLVNDIRGVKNVVNNMTIEDSSPKN